MLSSNKKENLAEGAEVAAGLDLDFALSAKPGELEGRPFFTEETHFAILLKSLDSLLNQILWIQPSIARRKFAGSIAWDVMHLNYDEVRAHFPVHRLSPTLDIAERLVAEWSSRGLLPLPQANDALTSGSNEATCLEFLRQLSARANEADVRSARKNFKRKFRKNHQGLLAFLVSVLNSYARVLAIRIDLSYRKAQSWPQAAFSTVSFEQVQAHRLALLEWLKANFAVAGYAWRLEYGLLKGFHYHFLVLLDGSEHQREVAIGRLIGEKWSSDVTSGEGIYWNCNADQYRWRGIGMLDHRDTPRIKILLEKVAPYLTKPDEAVDFVAPGNARTFGRSITLRPRSTPRGRPRTPRTI